MKKYFDGIFAKKSWTRGGKVLKLPSVSSNSLSNLQFSLLWSCQFWFHVNSDWRIILFRWFHKKIGLTITWSRSYFTSYVWRGICAWKHQFHVKFDLVPHICEWNFDSLVKVSSETMSFCISQILEPLISTPGKGPWPFLSIA